MEQNMIVESYQKSFSIDEVVEEIRIYFNFTEETKESFSPVIYQYYRILTLYLVNELSNTSLSGLLSYFGFHEETTFSDALSFAKKFIASHEVVEMMLNEIIGRLRIKSVDPLGLIFPRRCQ